MYKKLKDYLEVDDSMHRFAIGFIFGLIICITIQFQSLLPIETWFWFIGIIVILYVGLAVFFPPILRVSFIVAGFAIGVIISLGIWIFLPEIQTFFSSFFG
jgi:sulfite exporter TauE/SafE